MAIVAKCDCGHRFRLAEALAGRTIPCPKCGGAVLVPQPSAAAIAARSPEARRRADTTPSVTFSPMLIISATVGLILLVIVLALYLGPWTVGKQWAAMAPKANTDVTDVIQFSLTAYESRRFLHDAAISHLGPQVQGDATFLTPYMAFNMPRRIPFVGATNRGNYIGTYDTSSGEIAVDLETSGATLAMTGDGLTTVHSTSGKLHITGREKDGQVTAECNGSPLTIFTPKMKGLAK